MATTTTATPRDIMWGIGVVAAALVVAGCAIATRVYFERKTDALYESFANVCVTIPPMQFAKVIGLHYEPVFRGQKGYFTLVEVTPDGNKVEVVEPADNIVTQPVVACDPKFD